MTQRVFAKARIVGAQPDSTRNFEVVEYQPAVVRFVAKTAAQRSSGAWCAGHGVAIQMATKSREMNE